VERGERVEVSSFWRGREPFQSSLHRSPSEKANLLSKHGDAAFLWRQRHLQVLRARVPEKNSLDCLSIWSILTDTESGTGLGLTSANLETLDGAK